MIFTDETNLDVGTFHGKRTISSTKLFDEANIPLSQGMGMLADSNTVYPHCTAAVYTPNNCLLSESRTHFKPNATNQKKTFSIQPIPPIKSNQPFKKSRFLCSLWCFLQHLLHAPKTYLASYKPCRDAEVWKSRSLFLKAERSKFAGRDFFQQRWGDYHQFFPPSLLT